MKTKLSPLKIFSCIVLLALCTAPRTLSQIPQGFNYQAIARDGTTGDPVLNQSLPVRITIRSDSLSGTVFWQEVHSSITTNDFGMLSLVIGKGTRQDASTAPTFDAIDWSVTPKFIMTEIDQGSGFELMGSSRLWSVPYAMYSPSSNPWLLNGSSLYYASGFVGIETSTPVTPLTVTYNDNTGITYPLYVQNASGDWTATEKGVGLKFGRINPTSGHDYGTIRGTIASASGGDGRLQFIGGGGTNPHLTINHLGNVGIGTITPGFKLDVVGRSRFQTGGGSAGFWLMDNANTVDRSFIGMYNDDHVGFYGVGGYWGMVMNVNNGNVGIGNQNPAYKLAVAGNISANSYNGVADINAYSLELGGPNPTATSREGTLLFHHHGAVAHQLRYTAGWLYLEAAGTGYGTTNTPGLLVGGSLLAAVNGGNVGIGTTNPTSKLSVQPADGWSDETPLFEVKNKYGVPVLAVYNNGVRINVEHNEYSKSVKGGFAIGGFDYAKSSKTVDFMNITPDSIRFNINNKSSKAVKGGFAIGGYGNTKGDINEDFMYITPQASNNGTYTTKMGFEAGKNSSGPHNTFVGYYAGKGAASNGAASNIFIGEASGKNNFTDHFSAPYAAGSGNV